MEAIIGQVIVELPLGFEPRDHLLGIHAQLDDLERLASAHRLLLFGHIHHAATALANLLEQFVSANFVAGLFGGQICGGSFGTISHAFAGFKTEL
jgi:hypothetical protein